MTVTGLDDAVAGDRTATVTHTLSGAGAGAPVDPVEVTVVDDDAGVTVSESSVTVAEADDPTGRRARRGDRDLDGGAGRGARPAR